MPEKRLYSVLALAGALPFLAAGVISLLDIGVPAPLGSAESIALSYGLAIASFLCGVHWAVFLLRKGDVPMNLFVTSNVVLLAVWITYLLTTTTWALVTQIIAFAYLLLIDSRLRRAGIIESHYFRVRAAATALVTLSLFAVLI